MQSWPRSVQYALRALLVLVVLLPLLFAGRKLGKGTDLVTEDATIPTVADGADDALPALSLPPGESGSLPPSDGAGVPTTGGGSAISATVGGSPSTTGATTPKAPALTAPSGTGTNGMFEAIRNKQSIFSRYASVPSSSLNTGQLTVPTDKPDNGASDGEGQFRINCVYSHFNYDDPIVFPGQPGKSHLHMWIGNTTGDAYTTSDSLLNSGGSSCDGFELNRSAYWVPALLDGKGHAVAPQSVTIYYKTKDPANAVSMPQGLKMIAGNPRNETFTATPDLYWSCGGSGNDHNHSNRIPNCGDDYLNATIAFPNCWDGVHLDSADHQSHVRLVDQNEACPASHPKRLPQISILIYWKGVPSSGLYISSDKTGGFNTGPGATLHADWWGGWNKTIADQWLNNCIRPVRNCSGGQLGGPRMLAPLSDDQQYRGPTLLNLPAGAGPGLG